MTFFGKLPLAFAAGMLIASPALAQRQPQPLTQAQTAELFDTYDRNQNQRLEKAEWVASLPQNMRVDADKIWQRIQPNGQDFVTKDRFVAAYSAPPTPR